MQQDQSRFDLDATTVALSAVFGAAVTVGTMAISVPVGMGYLNFGEVIIYTAAFLFGRTVAGLAGGVGSAAADILLGYPFYAPITLVAKGTEGYVVGRLSGASFRSKAIAVAAGAPIMIGAYVLARAVLEGIPAAIFQELPMDVLQAVAGFVIAVPLSRLLEDRIPELR
ncbi:MAG: ECF transporter S component [Halodesulfurarchaeum sp.]